MSLTVGVDIGGTKIVAGVVDESGAVLATARRDTPGRHVAAGMVEDLIVAAVEDLRTTYDVSGVGIGAAGFVDAAGEHVRFAPHLNWRDTPVRAGVAERLRLPVTLDNDANAALWCEHRFGHARGRETALMVTLGTGIGGAFMVDGRLVRGHNGMAGEFGHVQVIPEGRPCECGRRGCWEQYCSGKALARFADEAGAPHAGPRLTRAAEEGDAVALGAFQEVGRWLGLGISGLVATLDPAVVIVGGGVADAGELLLAPARAVLTELLVGGRHREHPPVVAARLGSRAGLVGAADMVRTGR